jgi:membrane associated rhomboid family serine protease
MDTSDRPDTPQECARHPGRPAITVCSRCERPVCEDDIIEAPVGYQCVDCARSAPPVRRLGDVPPTPAVTRVLVGAIVAVALLGTTGAVDARAFGLVPVLVGTGEWWRLVTSAFLHGGLVHLAFNGLLLWRLGQMLEPGLGAATFLGVTASGLAGGSLGVISLSWLVVATPIGSVPTVVGLLGANPFTITVGASGAVFGLMGAVLVLLRRRGIDPWATSEGSMVGALVLLNLVLTVAIPSISLGGHVGGLLGGAAAAALVGQRRSRGAADALRTSLFALALLVAAAAVARSVVTALIG